MKKLTIERAMELKAMGITHIASTLRSHYNTTYYNINSIDAILANNGIQPSPARHCLYGYKIGVNGNDIDWNSAVVWSRI